MRKLGTVLVILILSGMVAVPAFAGPEPGGRYYCPYGSGPDGGGWYGPGGYGPGGYGPGWYGPRPYGPEPYRSNLTGEQVMELEKLTQAFMTETNELRNTLGSKDRELMALMSTSAPDEAKALALQKEISDIKATLSQKRIEYQLKAKKINPEIDFAPGMGYGRGMMGPNDARHWRGANNPMMNYWGSGTGYGPCWY